MSPGLVISTVNLKGGTAKTTSTAFLAHAFAEAGLSVLIIDADPQGSLQRWSDSAHRAEDGQAGPRWTIPVVGMPVRTLHAQLPGIVGDHQVVLIDTPPLEEQRGVVMSALRAASHVVVPVAPTPVEVERLDAVRQTIVDAADLRPDGRSPVAAVLLTRTVPQAASTAAWRAAMVSTGWHVLGAEVGRLERFAQAYGDPIVRACDTAYGYAVTELLDMEVPA
ncbi:MAG: chromosome partitioning protein [Actinomycetota bacterium]|nr:chromosome partitioning protein [Actinomycetota bacterium]